jgi:hypothetical protein
MYPKITGIQDIFLRYQIFHYYKEMCAIYAVKLNYGIEMCSRCPHIPCKVQSEEIRQQFCQVSNMAGQPSVNTTAEFHFLLLLL